MFPTTDREQRRLQVERDLAYLIIAVERAAARRVNRQRLDDSDIHKYCEQIRILVKELEDQLAFTQRVAMGLETMTGPR